MLGWLRLELTRMDDSRNMVGYSDAEVYRECIGNLIYSRVWSRRRYLLILLEFRRWCRDTSVDFGVIAL
jgi:hypothetical protein